MCVTPKKKNRRIDKVMITMTFSEWLELREMVNPAGGATRKRTFWEKAKAVIAAGLISIFGISSYYPVPDIEGVATAEIQKITSRGEEAVLVNLPEKGFHLDINDFELNNIKITSVEFIRTQDKLAFGLIPYSFIEQEFRRQIAQKKQFSVSSMPPNAKLGSQKTRYGDKQRILVKLNNTIYPDPNMPELGVRVEGILDVTVNGEAILTAAEHRRRNGQVI